MTYLSLVWAQLWRNPIRTSLTGASLAIAFLLFGLLQPINQIFSQGPAQSSVGRLVIIPKHSTSDLLPVSYAKRIEQIQGVKDVAHVTWFGGTYVDTVNFFAQYAITPKEFLQVMSELQMPFDQHQAFLSNRIAAIVGHETAQKYNWKIGDRIALIPNIWHNKNGAPWEFDLVGIYSSRDTSSKDNTSFYFGYDYFDDYRAFANGTVGSYVLTLDDPTHAAKVSQEIDTLFANSSSETKTLSDREYALSFAKQMGDVGLIVTSILGAVLFTILLLTANTIAQATRERIPELAVMKVLGFQATALLSFVLAESICLVVGAALIGLTSAQFLLIFITPFVPQLGRIGLTGIPLSIVGYGLLAALLIGLVVGVSPALKAMRLNIADALRA